MRAKFEQILKEIVEAYGIDAKERYKVLRKAIISAYIELHYRESGKTPRLPHLSDRELMDFIVKAGEEHEIERWGGFKTAYELFSEGGR